MALLFGPPRPENKGGRFYRRDECGDEWWNEWVLHLEVDPLERLRVRTKQKMSLSRYGRVDYHSWAHRPVSEIEEAMHALRELLEAENAPSVED